MPNREATKMFVRDAKTTRALTGNAGPSGQSFKRSKLKRVLATRRRFASAAGPSLDNGLSTTLRFLPFFYLIILLMPRT